MTYQLFSDTFLPQLAKSFREKKLDFHAMVDIDLWKKIFPEADSNSDPFTWSKISFNAFSLNDAEKSLLLVYTIPHKNIEYSAKFIGLRFNNKRSNLLLYYLRRPKYFDDPWEIFQYDFSAKQDYKVNRIPGTDSLREFKNYIEKSQFEEKPSLFDRVLGAISRL